MNMTTKSAELPGDTLRALADRQEIQQRVLEYCRAIDRGDLAGVRAVYTHDGVDHHTGFTGDADDYVAWVSEKLQSFAGTMHIVGNHLVELYGDHALAETYGTAVHWGVDPEDARTNFTSGFRYVDHFRREADGWRILERHAVREWTRSDAGRLMTPEGVGPRGTRDHHDPLYAARERVLLAG